MVLIKLDSSKVSEEGEDFSINFNNLELDNKYNYEVALVRSSIWYSYYNISSDFANNTLRYNNGSVWKNVTFDEGIYSVGDINTFLQNTMKANGDSTVSNGVDVFSITLTPNFTTLKVDVTISNSYQLDFTTSLLRELLGFTSIIVSSSQSGANPADITRGINSLVIKNSLVTESYDNGASSDILYSFVPNVSPGSLINIEPVTLIYLPINTNNYIHNIRMTLHDNKGRLVKLNGEHVFYLLDIRKIKKEE